MSNPLSPATQAEADIAAEVATLLRQEASVHALVTILGHGNLYGVSELKQATPEQEAADLRRLARTRENGAIEEPAIQTAQIIVAKMHERGEAITQLKLQKLLYYVQGWSKALLRQWRFQDNIEAWAHGPVVYSVRQKYASFGRGPIAQDSETYPPDDLLLDTVLSVYGQIGAEELVALTHKDAPWQKNYIPMEDRVLIPNDDIENFFSGSDVFKTKIHAHFFDAYRARKHDVRQWTPPGEASAEEIAEIEAAVFK
jgi:uncharacterized phage-associated protein